jgi:uncharacterized protein involved in type VI secretion and phage assembly
MSALVPVLRAIVRDELAAQRGCALGVVTAVYTNEGGSGDNNLALDVRLRGSAVQLQRVPLAVQRLGLSLAPRVGDLVVLSYVDGDLNAPVALGFLYDEQNRPPDAKVDEILYKIPEDEKSGVRRIEVELPNGSKLTLEDTKLVVTMGSTKVTVEADGAITLEAGGDVNLKAQGAINIEATGEAKLKGSSVTVEGQGSAKLKGATTTIAGTTNFSPS